MATKVQKFVDNGDGTYSAAATVTSTLAPAATAAVTSVTSNTTVVTLLAANTARKGGSIFNDSTAVLTIKSGTAASSTSFTTKIAVGGYFETPFGYTGVVTGLWASVDGAARVTEYV